MEKSKTLLISIILFLFFVNSSYAMEDTKDQNIITDELIIDQLNSLEINQMEELISNMNSDENIEIPNINLKEMIIQTLKGQSNYTIKGILTNILNRLFEEIFINSKLLAQIIFISVLCAILKNLSDSFGSSATSDIAFYGCYLIMVGILVKSFMVAMEIGEIAIDNMVSFMQALIPVLLSLLIAVGSITASAIFKPIIVASIGFSSTLIKDIVIPLVFLTAILAIVNNFTSKIQISKLTSLLKQISISLIGLILTIFMGVITIQGVIASSTDGVTLRTAKFALDNFIPIVGGFVSEAIDAVLGCSLLLKNAIGIVGLIIILIILSFPILKILSIILIYKVAAALLEPITDSKIVNCLNDMSSSLIILFGSVISVAIMFFIAITAVIGAGNITAMIR